ncbi:hypothetical protein ACET9H_16910 [Aeromonas media]|uniref:hypothetical protein n=1 Tax=Aeromonas media TaxID=651 RepID=UPI0038CFECE5
MIDLSLKLGTPISTLKESLSVDDYIAYRAFNYLNPFTQRSKLQREGLQLEIEINQNITKKSQYRKAEEFLPYLSSSPDWLEHPLVKKAKSLLSTAKTEAAIQDRLSVIAETLTDEISKPADEQDQYLITRLYELYKNNQKSTGD